MKVRRKLELCASIASRTDRSLIESAEFNCRGREGEMCNSERTVCAALEESTWKQNWTTGKTSEYGKTTDHSKLKKQQARKPGAKKESWKQLERGNTTDCKNCIAIGTNPSSPETCQILVLCNGRYVVVVIVAALVVIVMVAVVHGVVLLGIPINSSRPRNWLLSNESAASRLTLPDIEFVVRRGGLRRTLRI